MFRWKRVREHRWLFLNVILCRRVLLAVLLALVAWAGLVVLGCVAQAGTPDLKKDLAAVTRGYRFDLTRYTVTAVVAKIEALGRRAGTRLTPEEQRRLVAQYQARAMELSRLEDAIQRLYADPTVTDPETAAAAMQDRLAQVRVLHTATRPVVEAILERQMAATLAELGLTTAGFVFPPVRFDFSSPPNYLIVSPRDRIELEASLYLQPDLDLSVITALENEIAERFNRSVLIEGLGGIGAWPTVVLDRADLAWILETIAHEWVHNYLIFYPLGRAMFADPRMNTINETVATIVGQEVGRRLAHDVYGIPYPAPAPPPDPKRPLPPPDPNRFDFNTEMRRTRLRVDELLAAGRIEEAEAYMEERRRLFVAHGYPLRKLNQAYFAFHGSYATGAASTDPIGPKLQELRRRTPDLATFLRLVRGIRQPDDLDRLLAEGQDHP
jgi:hypothetical protein